MATAVLHDNGYLEYRCPACGSHSVPIMEKEKIPYHWEWNGDLEKPTLSPSVKHYHNGYPEEGIPAFCCHYFIRNGNIEFCGDCTHDKSGQTLPLPEFND